VIDDDVRVVVFLTESVLRVKMNVNLFQPKLVHLIGGHLHRLPYFILLEEGGGKKPGHILDMLLPEFVSAIWELIFIHTTISNIQGNRNFTNL
jgi:hypothetical protein